MYQLKFQQVAKYPLQFTACPKAINRQDITTILAL